jgi:hypothetical protein
LPTIAQHEKSHENKKAPQHRSPTAALLQLKQKQDHERMEGFSSGTRISIYLTHNHAEKSCLPCTIAANDTNNAYNPNTQIKRNVVSSSSSSSNGFLNFHHFWDLHPMFWAAFR